MGKICGETFGPVRFHGAGAGCGVRVRERVRFTCGQDFARTAGSVKRTKQVKSSAKLFDFLYYFFISTKI